MDMDDAAQKLPRSTLAITISVPPHIAEAWEALPAEQRASYERAIVEAWLEPLTRIPQNGRTLVPYCTTSTPVPRPDIPLPTLEALPDDTLARLIHQAEDLLEARWPRPPLTADTAALFETDRQHPETNAALYHSAHGREVCPAKERQRMTETNQPRVLVATLRDALQKIESELGLTRGGVDEIDTQAARLREGITALSALRQEEAAAVGIDMVIDAATELLQAFSNLESALPDAQADVETLEAEREDNEHGRDA
jgi:hypothetical protein